MTAPDAPRDADVPSRFHVDFTGRTLRGTYRVDRRLAEGGMGAVYLAQDLNLGRRVVVKVPHVRFLAEPGFRARFRREVEELVRLEHPSIVRILAQGEEDEVPFFVLQYLGGGSLEDRLGAGPASPETVVPWLHRIAETLDYVHGQGVVHRDVKPGNILFDEHGHVFLSDFGVVKALARDEGAAALTEDGTGVGSPVYMAPEQALGRDVGPAADQYALASTVYEALTGAPPFGRDGGLAAVIAKAKEPAPPLRSRRPDVPARAAEAVDRALATDPAQRFPWCAAFAEAFRAGLATAPTAASLPPPPAPARRTAFVATFAAVALLAAGALVALGLRRGEPPAPAPPAVADETPGTLVRLGNAGAAPRAVLRMHPPVGAASRLRMGMLQTLERTVEGLDPVAETQRLEQDADITVEGTGPAGASLRWRLGVPSARGADGAPAAAPAALVALGVGTGTSVLTPRGVATAVQVGFEGKGPRGADVSRAIVEVVRMLAVPLPAEPVGVGAEWDVTALLEVAGVRYQETSTYRLVARDGDVVTLHGEVRYASPPQTMDAPAGDAVATISLNRIEGTGSLDVVLDARLPAPATFVATGDLAFAASATVDGGTRTIRFRKRFESDVKPR